MLLLRDLLWHRGRLGRRCLWSPPLTPLLVLRL